MINLLISLAAGAAAWLLSVFLLDWFWAGMVPFFITAIGVYIYLARKVNRQLEKLAMRAQKEMEKVQNARSKKQRDLAVERAIDILKEGFEFKNRQFLVEEQLSGQIGQLYYVQKKFSKARPYLEKCWSRNWISKAMLACLHYMDDEYDEMVETFEETLKHNKKESLLWNLYGWCLWKAGRRDDAIDVLARGHEAMPDDDRIEGNLTALRNKRKMKMRGWREQWYQFHLEAPPAPKMRIDRRALRGR